MNDMEEEIDRIEKISYMKINNHYNSQIAYTVYYKTRVHMYSIILHALKLNVHSMQWVRHVYVTNIIIFYARHDFLKLKLDDFS